jgi:hypothetical protein
MMRLRFSYAAEKFGAARRGLMLPHPKGESQSVAGAFHECSLGLKDLPRQALDENARKWVGELEELMNTDGIPEDSRGAWYMKAERLTVEEKFTLSGVVDELADWFDRENHGSQ